MPRSAIFIRAPLIDARVHKLLRTANDELRDDRMSYHVPPDETLVQLHYYVVLQYSSYIEDINFAP